MALRQYCFSTFILCSVLAAIYPVKNESRNAMIKEYPQHHEHVRAQMQKLIDGIPGPMAGFWALHQEAISTGVLSTRVKELIALGIAIAVRCDGCLAVHVHDALMAGATREEIAETIGVAVMMGGGPAVVYGAEAYEAMEQFEADPEFERPVQQEAEEV